MPVSKLSSRFVELIEQLKAVEATRRRENTDWGGFNTLDKDAQLNWRVKARNLIGSACGKTSEHYTEFVETEKPQSYRDRVEETAQLKAIFLAAQEDYDGGYLDSVSSLVHAEVFSSELDQATELLAAGYVTAAAVVAGVVLETAMRKMCNDRAIAVGKLNLMNADLTKAGVYNLLTQKRITAIADIRNNAAHGNPTAFTGADVRDMIRDIERFLSEYT